MKKIILTCVTLLIIVLTGCSVHNTPDANRILSDFNAEYSDMAYANFNNAVIESESTNDSVYVAHVNFTGADTYAKYQLDTDIYYSKLKDKGWVFDKRGFTASSNVRYTVEKGRTLEEIHVDITENARRYISDNPKNINIISSQFDPDSSRDCVTISWEERNGDVASCYEGTLNFVYKLGGKWEYEYKNITDEKHTIKNLGYSVWRYKNNIGNYYSDFIIKSISEDGLTVTAEYNGKTYTGYLDSNKKIKYGNPEYTFSGEGEIKSVIINYAINEYYSFEDYYVNIYFNSKYGGYTKFKRVQ